jgi:hypothetical protein
MLHRDYKGKSADGKHGSTTHSLKFSLASVLFVNALCSAAVAEVSYSPVLPQFGGSNGQALVYLQYEKQLSDAREAKAQAVERAILQQGVQASRSSTAASRLIDALTSQLQYRLALGFTDEILNGATSNRFDIGGTLLEYTRIDGMLTVIITELGRDPVRIELPVAN